MEQNQYYDKNRYDVFRNRVVYALIGKKQFIFPNFATLKDFEFFDDITEIFYKNVPDVNVLTEYPKNLRIFTCPFDEKKIIKSCPKCGIIDVGM